MIICGSTMGIIIYYPLSDPPFQVAWIQHRDPTRIEYWILIWLLRQIICVVQSERESVDNLGPSGKSRRVSIPELPLSSSPSGSLPADGPLPAKAGPQPTSRQSSTQTEGLEEIRPRRQVRIMELPFRDSQPKFFR